MACTELRSVLCRQLLAQSPHDDRSPDTWEAPPYSVNCGQPLDPQRSNSDSGVLKAQRPVPHYLAKKFAEANMIMRIIPATNESPPMAFSHGMASLQQSVG